MHADFNRASELTGAIIGSAIEVHRDKGPGLIESIYQWCLEKELELFSPVQLSFRANACSTQHASWN
jgi:GxxExxY protein